MRGIYRCVICDKVSSAEVAEEMSDVKSGRYFKDEISGGYRCPDCHSSIRDVMSDYFMDDLDEGEVSYHGVMPWDTEIDFERDFDLDGDFLDED